MNAAWIKLGDDRWLFDEESWTLTEWSAIKKATGLTRIAFLNGLLEEDPDALRALVWFLRVKTEPTLLPAAVNFRPVDLEYERVQEPDADPPSSGGAAPAADPLTTSTGDGTSTSSTSPSASASAPVMSVP